MAQVYFKDTDGALVQIPLGSSGTQGTVKTTALTSVDRDAVLTAGAAFTVPEYEVGSGNLSVYWNGLLCAYGATYSELTSTSIAFADDVPTDVEITAMAIEGDSYEGKLNTSTVISESRDAVLPSGEAFAVPEHLMGYKRLRVYLDGVQLAEGLGFVEVSASAISFTFDLPAHTHVCVTALVFV